MANYRWSCKACGQSNNATAFKCEVCNCAADANGLEVEQLVNPEGAQLRSARHFDSHTFGYILSFGMFIPMLTELFGVNGPFVDIAIFLLNPFISLFLFSLYMKVKVRTLLEQYGAVGGVVVLASFIPTSIGFSSFSIGDQELASLVLLFLFFLLLICFVWISYSESGTRLLKHRMKSNKWNE